MLDERSIQIIKKIIESSYILKDELMSSCGLTKRQLEYSIEKINDWIKTIPLGLREFIFKYTILLFSNVQSNIALRIAHLWPLKTKRLSGK